MLFRAQDKYSAETLRFYAHLAEADGCDPNLISLVREQSFLMDSWPTKKTPDL